MRGFELRRRAGVDAAMRFVDEGSIRGALFDLGPYPAAIAAEGRVLGELYAILDPSALLPQIDAIEGVDPHDQSRSPYRRAVELVDHGGRRTAAWVYLYQRPLGSAVWIPSGDYRRHCRAAGLRVRRAVQP